MAQTLRPKAPTETVRYAWQPALVAGDYLATGTPVVSSGTVTIARSGVTDGEAFFYVAGGAVGETAVITVTATTTGGQTLTETFYVPVRAKTAALGTTVSEVVGYALRPIIGIGTEPEAAEEEDARENLDLMLTEWALSGADLGVKLPTEPEAVLNVPDGYVLAIKANLRVRLCELYGQPLTAMDVRAARRGEILVKFNSLPRERAGTYY